jgi:DNA-binding LacI/PurR family transcriptional regulator
MDDVAVKADVSRALVSLVMRGSPKVSPQRRAAVLTAAEELGYSPHAMARQLASRTSTVVGVLVSDLHNPYFADVVDGLEETAHTAGLQIILGTGGRRPDDERRAVETLLSFRPAGLVLLSPVVPSSVLSRAAALVPVVAVERTVRLREVDTVTDDGRTGSALAVEHLAGLGHQAIVHLDGGTGSQSDVRRRGFLEAVRRRGLTGHVEPSEYTEEAGAASVGRLLASGHRFTAVVAANDLNAVGAMAALEDAGLRVPGDVSIVGYDNTSLAALRHVGLTTVDQPRAEMGRRALRTLLTRLAEQAGRDDDRPAGRDDDSRAAPVREMLRPTLVVRRSTAAC